MSPLWPPLRLVLEDLSAIGARAAVVGGLAAGARTEPRFTRDVHVAVAVDDDAHAEAVVRHLKARGYSVALVAEQEAAGRLSTVRVLPPREVGVGVVVDLLFASCGIEPEIVAAAEAVRLAVDLEVPVARAGHLLAMKLLSATESRPQDGIDIVALVTASTDEEIHRAREAVDLIVRRGYGRGRDLHGLLENAIRARV